jgi:hypothetical protein
MGEALVEVFRAGIKSPFEPGHKGKLFTQVAEGRFNGPDGFFGGFIKKFEQNHMPVYLRFLTHLYTSVE